MSYARMPHAPLILSAAACLLLLPIHALAAAVQENPAPAKPTRLTFEVASIHPADSKEVGGGIKAIAGGNGYTARNVPVKLMIGLMYKVPLRQIKGGPDWLDSERFDIEARADHPYNIDDLHTMFQNLLADRFGLKFHIENKEGPAYALTVDPSGLKMKPNTSVQDYNIPMQGPPQRTDGVRVPMSYLTWYLGQVLQNDQRPVIDETGLTGNYDFTLSYAPELPPGTPSDALPPELRELPSIFTAVKEQLGLKLTPQKAPVPYYVIDQLEKPTDN